MQWLDNGEGFYNGREATSGGRGMMSIKQESEKTMDFKSELEALTVKYFATTLIDEMVITLLTNAQALIAFRVKFLSGEILPTQETEREQV